MRILWITNNLFPDVCKEIGVNEPLNTGWTFSSANALLKNHSDINLAVATLYDGDHLKTMVLNGITYFLVPKSGSNKVYSAKLEYYWKDIQEQYLPDVVHIHGTEYPHGLAYINACGNHHVVVSIQGLVNVYERYYYGEISIKQLLKMTTLRDIIRRDTIFNQHKNMQQRGLIEKITLKSVQHIIGRTSWDKAHSWATNPQANYHFCNEILRNKFYESTWTLKNCEKNSIFLSQAHYPIKGFQQIIKALPLILRHYPNTKIYVAGNNFFTNRGWRLNGFGNHIRSLMKAYSVTNNIIFTGLLSETEICNRYLSSHVFICPSSIENSPNSIGEAQLLGVPCVASYVGGIANMVTDGETGLLYRFEEFEMLAAAVCRIFANDSLALKLSEKSRESAITRHDKLINAKSLNNIYRTIYNDIML